MTEQPQQVYQYSVKLEADQKCIKPSVHVYGNDAVLVSEQAINLLQLTIEDLKMKGFTVAPLEVKEKER